MPVHNADIAALFEEIADRLEIQGANPFRIRAYRNAARTLGELPQEARALGATVGGVTVWSLYVPNGRSLDDPHYLYKLDWLEALRGYTAETRSLAR